VLHKIGAEQGSVDADGPHWALMPRPKKRKHTVTQKGLVKRKSIVKELLLV
jgi:hypothetical protein